MPAPAYFFQAMAARRSGDLYTYKCYANAVKRHLIREHAADAPCLVDIGCGRGGDLSKWRHAGIRTVVATDVSPARLAEARVRAARGAASHRSTDVEFQRQDMLDSNMAAHLFPALQKAGAVGGADAVAAMFCIQFAFGTERAASTLLREVGLLLRPNGVFFGIAPDAAAVLHALRGREEATLEPPEVPAALRLRRLGPRPAEPPDAEFGQALSFCLEDTVTQESDAARDPQEYLVWRHTLARLAAAEDLEVLHIAPLDGLECRQAVGMSLSQADARVASLYFTFAFQKRGWSAAMAALRAVTIVPDPAALPSA